MYVVVAVDLLGSIFVEQFFFKEKVNIIYCIKLLLLSLVVYQNMKRSFSSVPSKYKYNIS